MPDADHTPRFHADGSASWDMSEEGIRFITDHVRPGSRTLETGAGASTLTFLQAGARHTAITPQENECDAIRAEAIRRGLDESKLDFVIGFSQDVLPGLTLSEPLDFVLIDGGHGFPIPAVDWLYTACHMKVGGVMMIDDVDLWTGKMLVDFLKSETGWSHLGTFRGRTTAFRMTKPFEPQEWVHQPFVVSRSRWSQRMRKMKNLAGLVASGKFSTIRSKIEHEKHLKDTAR